MSGVVRGPAGNNDCRIYVGNLPPDIRTKDVEDVFYKYGTIRDIDLKNRRGGPPFAFIEFEDPRWGARLTASLSGRGSPIVWLTNSCAYTLLAGSDYSLVTHTERSSKETSRVCALLLSILHFNLFFLTNFTFRTQRFCAYVCPQWCASVFDTNTPCLVCSL